MSLSWLASANRPETDFPLENLPYGAFEADSGAVHLGVAIGDQILDLYAAAPALTDLPAPLAAACAASVLNPLMALGPEAAAQLRVRLTELLRESPCLPVETVQPWLRSQAGTAMRLPVEIGDYSDFYASLHHALRVGVRFRPDQPLQPNYKHLPVAYHGRSSSIVLSPQSIRRPCGQRAAFDFGPTRQLDFELEVGFFIGHGNATGEPIPLTRAPEHIFGFCLLNDWSARDLQRWEYPPLGPFLGKNFATSLSPWVVTRDALQPFRCPPPARAVGDPQLLPYLDDPGDRERGAWNIDLEVELSSSRMSRQRLPPQPAGRVNLRGLYWTPAQMLAHHTSNGCNLRPGDLLATGTVSGPEPEALGCLLERSAPLVLPTGERRDFLEDGDEVVFTAHAFRPGAARIGWGECRGRVLPAAAV